MNWETLINSPLVVNLGWTLVHSIWQIGLIALVLFFILRASKNLSANARYSFAVAALFLTLLLPLATFVQFANGAAQNQSAGKNYDFENADLIKTKIQTAETISMAAANKAQAASLSNEDGFFSFENSVSCRA